MFGLFRFVMRGIRSRRQFPSHWSPILEKKVPFYHWYDATLQKRFRHLLKLFIWEKYFISAGGMKMTNEVKVVIGSCAVRLILHLNISYYNRLTEIVVYPYIYKHEGIEGGILGEAHQWGTVVLSWPAVLHGLKNIHDGHDTASHEFAHVLDIASGRFDGTPVLKEWDHYSQWAGVLSQYYLSLREGGRETEKYLEAVRGYQ